MRKTILSLTLLACFSMPLLAQGTVEDYKRAFAQRAKYSGKVYYDNVQPSWIGGTHHFWYVRNTPEGRIYSLVNADKQKRTELFNHEKLAKALKEATKRDYRANALHLDRLAGHTISAKTSSPMTEPYSNAKDANVTGWSATMSWKQLP